MHDERRAERVPDRRLPAAYLIFAHLCLLAGLSVFAVDPSSVSGFFYHPRMVAVVHLITLGWITGSILGALHFVLPMAMRSPLPARRLDRWAFWFFVIGVLGMVSHFWIDEPSGMAWSAAMVILTVLRVGYRVVVALTAAPVPFEHRLPFALAFLNMLLAATLGLLIGIDKSTPLLAGYILDQVAAHAHLAALGWATFMVMGSAYRLLPMLLPSAVPRGRGPLAATLLCETGVLGLTAALYVGSRLALIAAAIFVLGIATFLRQVLWMRAHPKPAPKELRRPDFGVLHVGAAFAHLVVATGLGAAVLLQPDSPSRVGFLTAYGVTLLVGFLSQMVVGVSLRFLPLYAWMRDFSAGGFDAVPLSPHERTSPGLHALSFACWTLGAPLLAVGLGLGNDPVVRIAGALLVAAVAASFSQLLLVLRHRDAT